MANQYKFLVVIFLYLTAGFITSAKAQIASSDAFTTALDTEEEIFEKGLKELDSGNQEKAIEIWSGAMDKLANPGYRIGYYMIKTVTAHQLKDYYELASKMYYLGLEDENLTDDEVDLISLDVKFTEPLLERREKRKWTELVENRDAQILTHIKEFWDSVNMTISDTYNERLLEHWERSSYVSRLYDSSSRSYFDDRGAIYIRFGEPSKKKDGTLLFNSGFAEYVLSARMSDGGTSGNPVDQASFINTNYMVRNYHEYPQYEVWAYQELVPDQDDVVYLFGNKSGSGVMSLMRSIDEFVPSAAFNTEGRNRPVSFGSLNDRLADQPIGEEDTDVALESTQIVTQNKEMITPGLVLQLMYYRQFAAFDDFFSSRYSDMMDRYMSTTTYLGKSISKEFQLINTTRLLRRQGRAPQGRSSYENRLFRMESDLYAYRFLNNDLEPYLKVYLETNSDEAVSYEELKSHNSVDSIDQEKYELIKQIKTENESGDVITSQKDTVRLGESKGPLQENMTEIPHNDETRTLRILVEFHNREQYSDSSISDNTAYKRHLKGMGLAETEVEENLEIRGFTASDVILGFSTIDSSTDQSSFTVAHSREIPHRTNLNFYYEAYNLPQNDEGLYSFTLTYEISKKRGWFGNLARFGKSNGPSITIENTNETSIFSQQLEIVSEELSKGDYVLTMTFESPDGSRLLEKDIEFEIQ